MIIRIKGHSTKGWIILNETKLCYVVTHTNQIQQRLKPYNRRKSDTVIYKVMKRKEHFTFDKPWSEVNKQFNSANFKEF